MSYREELEQQNSQILDQAESGPHARSGAPRDASHHVRGDADSAAVARPGGAAQNSASAFAANGAEEGDGE